LESLARGDGPTDALITMGYAGWGAGQLEEEIAANAWLTVPAQRSVLFATPAAQRFTAAVSLLGINLAQLTTVAGHA
jgi:putative transcriptional regulator